MFDIGFTELMLIGIVALVVIGPERLPAVAKTAGQWIAKLQRFVRGVKTDLASELDAGDLKKLLGDQRVQIDELRKMVTSAKNDFETSTNEAVQGAKSALNDMETKVSESDATTTPADKATVTASTVAAATVASSEGVQASDKSDDDDTSQTQFETLDGKTVSVDDSADPSDIGRTGS